MAWPSELERSFLYSALIATPLRRMANPQRRPSPAGSADSQAARTGTAASARPETLP